MSANPNEHVYIKSAFKENRSEGTIWIGGKNAQHISITGGGIINGQDIHFMAAETNTVFRLKPFTDVDPRPHLLTLVGCLHVTIRDATFSNSAYWCLHLAGCRDIVINGVRILNGLKVPNCDGIIQYANNEYDIRAMKLVVESLLPNATGVDEGASMSSPEKFFLEQNYPNPFNGSTKISYELPSPARVSLSIYTISGQRVTELKSGFQQAGRYTVNWDGTNDSGLTVPSGVYVYKLVTGASAKVRKMIYVR